MHLVKYNTELGGQIHVHVHVCTMHHICACTPSSSDPPDQRSEHMESLSTPQGDQDQQDQQEDPSLQDEPPDDPNLQDEPPDDPDLQDELSDDPDLQENVQGAQESDDQSAGGRVPGKMSDGLSTFNNIIKLVSMKAGIVCVGIIMNRM